MNGIPFGVLAIYAAVGIWAIIAVRDFRRKTYWTTLVFGIVLALILNVRYIIEGAPSSIAFFVGIYDMFDNMGLGGREAAALTSCAGNDCSVSGYLNHPSWGVAFYERFASGPQLRTNLLYGHIIFNTIVFVMLHVQLLRPGRADGQGFHRLLGQIMFACLTIATVCAVWLAAEHGSVGEYGGNLSKYGFWFMSFCVYGTAIMGIVNIRSGDTAAHRIWMIRFAGSMWGSFWLFRLMLLVTGPLFRNWEAASILFNIWFSAPIGIIAAEALRIRWERRGAVTYGESMASAD